MAVPDYQSFMLPLLNAVSDGKEYSLGEVVDTLAEQFNLSDEDRNELIPSGKKTRLNDRVGWAQTYLRKAGLLERTRRGKFRITERGREVLKSQPDKINVNFLEQFPEFIEFRTLSRQDAKSDVEVEAVELSQTPEELLGASYQTIKHNLAQELLERTKKCSPSFFERLVVELLVSMGYGGSFEDAQTVGRSGDGGIDGIIKEDKLGLDVVYVQAKRWEGTVGRPVVQAFSGSLDGQRAKKGVLITTSQFSLEAKDYVSRIDKKIVLIDGEQLAQLMIDHGIGVAELATYTIKKIDLDWLFGNCRGGRQIWGVVRRGKMVFSIPTC
jgi:restriction system protein